MNPQDLLKLADDRELMEIGRRAIEDTLIEWRDSRMFELRNNGFSIREKMVRRQTSFASVRRLAYTSH